MRSTSVRSFFDTNILVHTDDLDAPLKRRRALDLVREHGIAGRGALSTQVLQEYFVATTRKLRTDPELARRKVELFAQLDLVQIDLSHVLEAIDLNRLHQFSIWDALILVAARRARCSVLFTEDLQHNSSVFGVTIVNPFLGVTEGA